MIIVLIFIGLIVLSFILLCIGVNVGWDDEWNTFICGIFCFSIVGCITAGLWCIVVNTPLYVKNETYELQEKFKLYENEKDLLLSFHPLNENSTTMTSDKTLEIISTNDYYVRVTEYNKKIYDFKVNVVGHKNRRNSPWTSWFESSAWDVITTEMLDSLTYTTGK